MAIPGNARRRRLDFRNWRDVLTDIEHLQRAGYDRVGNWDLSQTLDHVGEGLRTAQHGAKHQGAWVVRKLLGPILLRWILRQRKMQAGMKVPAWWLPGPASDESAAVAKFRAEVSAFDAMTPPCCPHPLLGAMTKQQWNDLALIHAAHHLSFLLPRDNR